MNCRHHVAAGAIRNVAKWLIFAVWSNVREQASFEPEAGLQVAENSKTPSLGMPKRQSAAPRRRAAISWLLILRWCRAHSQKDLVALRNRARQDPPIPGFDLAKSAQFALKF